MDNISTNISFTKATIIFSSEIPQDVAEYIADCWITFLTEDLAMKPADGIIVFS